MKRRQVAFASVRPRPPARPSVRPLLVRDVATDRPTDRGAAGRKANFSSRRETADAFGISSRWESEAEEGGERGRGTNSLVAALLPYYDGILSPRGSGVPDWPDEKVALSLSLSLTESFNFTTLLLGRGRTHGANKKLDLGDPLI